MNWYLIKVLFQKELVEIWRDKKTLFRVVLLPMFLYPVIVVFVTQIANIQSKKINVTKIPLTISVELENTPLFDSLARDSQFVITRSSIDFTKENLMEGITISIQKDAARDSSKHLILYFDATSDYNRTAKEKIERLISRLNTRMVEKRLEVMHIEKSFLKPLDVKYESTASKEKFTGSIIGKVIPGILMFFIFIGSVYIAMDITAGEKERKTLQSLYASPITSYEIITGKFLAVYVVSLASAFANMCGMLLSVGFLVMSSGAEILSKVGLDIGIGGIFWIVALLIVLTGIIAAVSLSVLSMARTHKEASSYMGPLMIVFMLPMMVYNLPAMELSVGTSMVPILNILLALNAILKGSYSATLVLGVVITSVCYLIFVLLAVNKIFASEGVITGEKVNYKILLEAEKNKRKVFGVFEALLFFAIVFMLYLYVGTPIMLNTNILLGHPLAQILVLGGCAFAAMRMFKLNLRKDLQLQMPNAGALLGTVLMAIGMFFSIALLTYSIMDEEFAREFGEQLKPIMETNFFYGLFLIAVIPAVFEELVFRGIMFHGLRQQMSPWAVILISSLAFSLMHMNLERLPHTFLIGLVLGFIMWRGKSFYLCVLFHFLINGTSFLISKNETLATLFGNNMMAFTIGGVILFLLGCTLFYFSSREKNLKS